jgi:hypothetical protein
VHLLHRQNGSRGHRPTMSAILALETLYFPLLPLIRIYIVVVACISIRGGKRRHTHCIQSRPRHNKKAYFHRQNGSRGHRPTMSAILALETLYFPLLPLILLTENLYVRARIYIVVVACISIRGGKRRHTHCIQSRPRHNIDPQCRRSWHWKLSTSPFCL